MPNSIDLTSYCGLYCPDCELHQGKGTRSFRSVKRIITTYNIDGRKALSNEESGINHHERYRKVLDGIKDASGGCVGCRNGGGIQDCRVRSCASDRGYRTCLDCVRMETCSELKDRPWTLPALRSIRDVGFDSWLKTKRDVVDAGRSYLDEARP